MQNTANREATPPGTAAADRPRTPDSPPKAGTAGLAARWHLLRDGQAALDGETRMRRLLVGILIVQIPVAIVLLLSGAFLGLVIDVLAVALQVVAALFFGPHDGDQHLPVRDEATEALVEAQTSELSALRTQTSRAEASSSLLADLARRHRALLVRQLTKIDELEAKEQDPTALGELFALDHLATRMRRCSEGVLVLSGRDESRPSGTPVAASEVLRGAVAEIEDFSRVEVTLDRDVTIVGGAVVDVVHLLAEVIENATVYSSPTTTVRVHGHSAGDAFAVSVTDQGVGMSPERLAELNRFLAEDDLPVTAGQVGFQVVAKLAARHGVYVGLAAPVGGGTEVTVVLPATLVADRGQAPGRPAEHADHAPAARLLDDEPDSGRDEQLDREFAAALGDVRPTPAVPTAPAVPTVPVAPVPPVAPVAEPVAYAVHATPPADDAAPAWSGHEVPDESADLLPYVPASPEPLGSPSWSQDAFGAAHPAAYDAAPYDENPYAEAHLDPYAETHAEPYAEPEPTAAYPTPSFDEAARMPSYEEAYAAQTDLPAPTWDELAWQPPAPAPAVPVAAPQEWRDPTGSPFVPSARVVSEPADAVAPPPSVEPAAAFPPFEPELPSTPADDHDAGGALLTRSGLRRRVPLANMAPEMSAPTDVIADETAAQPTPDRSRHLFSAYRDGLTLGRTGGLDAEPTDSYPTDEPSGEDR